MSSFNNSHNNPYRKSPSRKRRKKECNESEGEDAIAIPTPSSNPYLPSILPQLRKFQREAYDFATTTNPSNKSSTKLLLADEMGLGKSVTSLSIMTHYYSSWPLLVLVPASLRYTWPAEIEKFLPTLPSQSIYVVQGFEDVSFAWKRCNVKIVVASYSLLQKRAAAARALQDFGFECVIADESHNLKQKNSQRCELAMPILKKAKRLLLLSGTPALAR